MIERMYVTDGTLCCGGRCTSSCRKLRRARRHRSAPTHRHPDGRLRRPDEPVAAVRHPLKPRYVSAGALRQARVHRVLGDAMAEHVLNRSAHMRRAHGLAFVAQHPDDGVNDPARTAITLTLALDGPWRRIAPPQPGEALGYIAQPGLISRSQDLRNFCHKIARSTRMLVRWYLRCLHLGRHAPRARLAAGAAGRSGPRLPAGFERGPVEGEVEARAHDPRGVV
jgi:hypothetical protein